METLVPFLMASIIDDGVNVPGDIHHICVVGAWMIVQRQSDYLRDL